MKLRQKLAMVLASAMVVTAVPVVTFAASTARTTKVVVVADDEEIGSKAPQLVIDLKDGFTAGEFYVDLEGAEWTQETTTVSITGLNPEDIKVSRVNDTQMRIETSKDVTAKDPQVKIDLAATKLTADEAKAIIDGNNTEIDNATVVYATKSEAKGEVTVGDVPSFYTGTDLELAPIKVEEVVAGTFKDGQTITIELNNSDFEFVADAKDEQEVTINGTRGFKIVDQKATVKVIDEQTAVLTLSGINGKNFTRGGIEITGLEVKSTVKNPTLGDLEAEVYGEDINDKDIVVAKVAEYGVELSVKEVKEMLAGETEEVEITLEETTADSLMASTIEIDVEGGYFAKVPAGWEAVYEDEETTDKIIGIEKKVQATDKIDTILDEAKLEVYTELGTTGDVVLKATGRAISEEINVVVATVKEDIKVAAEAVNVEVGVKDQKGGKITITQDEKETLKSGTVFTIELPSDSDVKFTDEPEVSATGGMKVSVSDIKTKKVEEDGKQVTVPYVEVKVDKSSKEAATITVENFEMTTDRTIADGSYDAVVKMNGREGEITVENFIVVGEGVATTVTTTITNGATEMVVNGKKVELDAPAYIKNGKLMAPLRAVSEAFGIKASNIVYNAGEIMIFANGRTIQLTIGSNVAYVNGAKMTLANPAEIKSERTFVPVGDLGRLLGLNVKWDNATKTATFNN